jgi:hypothetical protein
MATLEFAVVGDSVTIFDMMIDEAGHENRGQNTILLDGQEHTADGGYVLTARWHGPHTFETAATKDGLSVGWGKYEVSQDGKV